MILASTFPKIKPEINLKLKKKYREVLDGNGKTGNSSHTWKYVDTFQEAYGHKAGTAPKATFDSQKEKENNTDNLNIDNSQENNPTVNQKKRKRASVDDLLEKIEETNSKFLQEMKSEHDKKMTRMDRFLDIYQSSLPNNSLNCDGDKK